VIPRVGHVVEERFSADRESLARWAEPWRGRVVSVAIEATAGLRWVWRELVARGFELRLAEPLQARGVARPEAEREDRPARRPLACAATAKDVLPDHEQHRSVTDWAITLALDKSTSHISSWRLTVCNVRQGGIGP
jgi:transposase